MRSMVVQPWLTSKRLMESQPLRESRKFTKRRLETNPTRERGAPPTALSIKYRALILPLSLWAQRESRRLSGGAFLLAEELP